MGGDQSDGTVSIKVGTMADIVLRKPLADTMTPAAWRKAFAQFLQEQHDLKLVKAALKEQSKPGSKWYTSEEMLAACGD